MPETEAALNPGSSPPAKAPASVRRRVVWWLAVLGVCFSVCGGFVALFYHARQNALEATCKNHLRLIGLALNSYADAHRCYPPAQACDDRGRPIQSWRTHLMVYLGYYHFRESYDLSEPWDSQKNRLWADTHLYEFVCPNESRERTRLTNYVAVVGPETMWPARRCTRRDEVVNPDAIFVVEFPESDILWAEPRDLTVEEFLAMLEARWARRDFGPHPSGLLYLTARGEVRALGRNTDLETVRQLLRARKVR